MSDDNPSGFDDDALEQSQIESIRLGEQLSASMIRITIERGEYLRGTPASRELENLAEHDMNDDEYDEEAGVIDYQCLSPGMRERTDALIEYSLRPEEYFERDDGEEGSDVSLRRQGSHDRVSEE